MWERIKDFFSSNPAEQPVRVLVVGDVMLDTYVRGTVDRISPEAPVQVLNWNGEPEYALGGAANVACNLTALGCEVHLMGTAGNDSEGDKLRELLDEEKVNTDALVTCQERPTTHKTRIIASSQQVIRIDREKKNTLPDDTFGKLSRHLGEAVSVVDGIICADYTKGVLSFSLMKELMLQAKLHKVPVVVDPKGDKSDDYAKYSGCYSITPNEKELSQATERSINSDEELETAARDLMARLNSQSVMVTRGERGITLVTDDGGAERIGAEAREVYDVTGAGDTVVSVFGMALFGGLAIGDAAAAANAAGGIVVGKLGTSVVAREEILHYFQNRERTAGSKVVELGHLQEELKRVRRPERKIVFTNGCFDPIHKGHIRLLENAAGLGDVLIVALNSDSSVRKLKGENRPSVTQEDRAYILGALEAVDYVIIFQEDTPENLISEIRPDYLVKGGDYKPEEVVGKELVESYGGEVKLIPLVKDKSSTRYLKSVVEKNR